MNRLYYYEILFFTCFSLLFPISSVNAQASSDWPTFQKDHQNSGFNEVETMLKPPLNLLWTIKPDNAPISNLVFANNMLYAKSNSGIVYALDGETGSIKWQYQSSAPGNVTVANNVVYAGNWCRDCSLDAFNATNGQQLWSTTGFTSGITSGITVVEDKIYFGSEWNVYAVDSSNGQIIWRVGTDDAIFATPAYNNGKIYAGTYQRSYYAIDASNGSVIWKKGNLAFSSSSSIITNNILYQGSEGAGPLPALDPTNGNIIWQNGSIGGIRVTPSLANSIIYAQGQQEPGKVAAINATNGNTIWTTTIGHGYFYNSSVAVANGVIYIGANNTNKMYAIDAQTGSVLWDYTASSVPNYPITADHKLFFTSDDGKIYAFGLEPISNPIPEPFLDLPWDYKAGGKSFIQQAFNPESWFDHKYPLQNYDYLKKALIYDGIERNVNYRGHAGYDYASRNEVEYKTPVLAAASGRATFFSKDASDSGLGNYIKIDHKNGYQTWYGHLDDDNHIVGTVNVNKGQKIGETGWTGNVFPKNQYGSHIRFAAFKNENGNKKENGDDDFSDDYPYGLVDPLGWNPENKHAIKIDPWTEWKKDENDLRHGAISYNLFTERLPPVRQIIKKDENAVITNNKATIFIPKNMFPVNASVTVDNGPFESDGNELISIVPSLIITAKTIAGDLIEVFFNTSQITYEYSEADIRNIDQESIKLFFMNDDTGKWEALATVDHNLGQKIITSEVNHFSRFALMGKIKDSIAPRTELIITGGKGKDEWYTSSISLELSSNDNEGGLGVDSTLYTLDGHEWEYYTLPISIDAEGEYAITFHSRDKAINLEDQKTIKFKIDKTPPVITINAAPNTIWPPNGKMVDVKITGNSSDLNISKTSFKVIDEYGKVEPVLLDTSNTDFTHTIKLEAKRNGNDKDGRIYKIQAIAEDIAGNKTTAETKVIVPHNK